MSSFKEGYGPSSLDVVNISTAIRLNWLELLQPDKGFIDPRDLPEWEKHAIKHGSSQKLYLEMVNKIALKRNNVILNEHSEHDRNDILVLQQNIGHDGFTFIKKENTHHEYIKDISALNGTVICIDQIADKVEMCTSCRCPKELNIPSSEHNNYDAMCNCSMSKSDAELIKEHQNKTTYSVYNSFPNNDKSEANLGYKRLILAVLAVVMLFAGYYWYISPEKTLKRHLNITKLDVTKAKGKDSCYWFDDHNNNLNERISGFAKILNGEVVKLNYYGSPLEIGAIETCIGSDHVDPLLNIFSGRNNVTKTSPSSLDGLPSDNPSNSNKTIKGLTANAIDYKDHLQKYPKRLVKYKLINNGVEYDKISNYIRCIYLSAPESLRIYLSDLSRSDKVFFVDLSGTPFYGNAGIGPIDEDVVANPGYLIRNKNNQYEVIYSGTKPYLRYDIDYSGYYSFRSYKIYHNDGKSLDNNSLKYDSICRFFNGYYQTFDNLMDGFYNNIADENSHYKCNK
ncbi:MAG: hypothetical protein WCG87_12085 [Bacteroidota bacterium]